MKKFILVCLMMAALTVNACSSTNIPFADKVREILSQLEYSGYQILVKPEVRLTLDFDKKQWTLHNTHAYDAEGNIILEQGRYGLCAELSTYVFERLNPLMPEGYNVRFANVAESDFFSRSQSNHIVLLIKEEATQNLYILDPSFQKYGRIGDYPEYTVLGLQESLTFIKNRTPDISFKADQAMPLYIKKDLLVSFAVTSVDGKFDEDNFLFVLSVNYRYQTEPLDIVVIGKRNGVVEELRRNKLLEQILNPVEFLEIYQKMNVWIREH